MKILANDGIDDVAKIELEKNGFSIDTNKINQDELVSKIAEYDAILVRSATKITKEIIDAGTNLKLIGRAGVGLDNIDVAYASEKNIKVVNTPAASSTSVAELVFSHLFGLCRMLQISNRLMPEKGNELFNDLKKQASKGIELKGKTIGIIGIGRIGKEVARIAYGLGMNVLVYDPFIKSTEISITFHPESQIPTYTKSIETISKDELLQKSDFVTLHIPGGQGYVIDENELNLMKKGSILVNCARGGVVNEKALLNALNSGHILASGLDVFEKEPPVFTDILKPNQVSLTPHIGASTVEAQKRIGEEMAEQIIQFFKSQTL